MQIYLHELKFETYGNNSIWYGKYNTADNEIAVQWVGNADSVKCTLEKRRQR